MKKQIRERKKKQVSKEETGKLRELHLMKCLKCGTYLIETDFNGLKIDEDPSLRGMWLNWGQVQYRQLENRKPVPVGITRQETD